MGSLPRLAQAPLWLWSAVAAAGEATHAEPLSSLHLWVGQAVDLLLLLALLVIGWSVLVRRRESGATGLWSWLVVPLLLLGADLFLVHPGHWWSSLHQAVDEDPLEVRVTGHQGWWEYEYGGAVRVTSFASARRGGAETHLLLPVGRAIRIVETSADVVHPFVVPGLGIRNEAMPGYFTETRITPSMEGLFPGSCRACVKASPAQVMVEVVSGARFDAWLMQQRGHVRSTPASAPRPAGPTEERRAGGAR